MASSVEKGLLTVYYKSVGIELGLYNPKTKKLAAGAESQPHYQANLETVRSYLAGGWTASELEEKLWELSRNNLRGALLAELVPRKSPANRISEDTNLLETGVVYQHPALYESRMPSYTVRDGVLYQVSPGESRPKVKFTLRDLAQYWFDHTEHPSTTRHWTSVLGFLRYLLTSQRVDEILHAMDIGIETAANGPQLPIVKLSDYLDEAIREVQSRTARAGEGNPYE